MLLNREERGVDGNSLKCAIAAHDVNDVHDVHVVHDVHDEHDVHEEHDISRLYHAISDDLGHNKETCITVINVP